MLTIMPNYTNYHTSNYNIKKSPNFGASVEGGVQKVVRFVADSDFYSNCIKELNELQKTCGYETQQLYGLTKFGLLDDADREIAELFKKRLADIEKKRENICGSMIDKALTYDKYKELPKELRPKMVEKVSANSTFGIEKFDEAYMDEVVAYAKDSTRI